METYNLNTILYNLHSGNNDKDWQRMYNICRNYIAESSKYSRKIRIQRREWWQLRKDNVFDNVIITASNGNLIPSYADGTTGKETTRLKEIFDVKC